MREIKFRAWNGKEIFLSNQIQSILFEYECPIISLTSRGGIHNSQEWDTRQVTLMQYTGLKDKNGKEVYESDIVKVEFITYSGTENEETIKLFNGEVFFHHLGYFCFSNIEDENEFYLFGSQSMKIEIIGNIHENTELCK